VTKHNDLIRFWHLSGGIRRCSSLFQWMGEGFCTCRCYDAQISEMRETRILGKNRMYTWLLCMRWVYISPDVVPRPSMAYPLNDRWKLAREQWWIVNVHYSDDGRYDTRERLSVTWVARSWASPHVGHVR
jgi:hypothetical protein